MKKKIAEILINKKGLHEYEILETYTTGIVLDGGEVKSLRYGNAGFSGASVTVRGGEAFLMNFHIPLYQGSSKTVTYDPYRPRKLLLTKKEINTLLGTEKRKGLTIIPIKIYNRGRFVKLEIGVAKKKRNVDIREKLKKRIDTRENTA